MRSSPSGHDGSIVVLQLLRGLAALTVIACHFLQRLVKREVIGPELNALTDYLGLVGVATFFAISGFIMIFTTHHRFGKPDAGARFLARRLVRIVPLYYATTIAFVILALTRMPGGASPTAGSPSLGEIALSAMFVPYLNGSEIVQPVYGLGWSLNFEMYFYALFAAAMSLRVRPGITVLTVLFVGLAGLGTWLEPPIFSDHPIYVCLYFYTRPVLLYFVIGIGVGLIRIRTAFRLPLNPLYAGLACSALLGCAMVNQVFVRVPIRALESSTSTYIAITLALCVAVFSRGRRDDAESADSHLARAYQRLGDVSYALYLTHSFVLGAVAFAASRTGLTGLGAAMIFTLLAFAACIVVANAVWTNFEQPVARFMRRRMRHQPDETHTERTLDRTAM